MKNEESHLPEEIAARYALRTVDDAYGATIEQHLLFCESCRARVDEERVFARAISEAAKLLPTDRERSRWRIRLLVPTFAMCGICALIVGRFPLQRSYGPPVTVSLVTMRGPSSQGAGPSGRPLLLQPDIQGLPETSSYPIEVVDNVGKLVWRGTLVNKSQSPTVLIPPQAQGVYFVRVYLSGEPLREYVLDLRAER